MGTYTSGSGPASAAAPDWPSVSIRMGSPQQPHDVSIATETERAWSRPCTKGAAIASIAQAAQALSPLGYRSRWGVGSAVKG